MREGTHMSGFIYEVQICQVGGTASINNSFYHKTYLTSLK